MFRNEIRPLCSIPLVLLYLVGRTCCMWIFSGALFLIGGWDWYLAICTYICRYFLDQDHESQTRTISSSHPPHPHDIPTYIPIYVPTLPFPSLLQSTANKYNWWFLFAWWKLIWNYLFCFHCLLSFVLAPLSLSFHSRRRWDNEICEGEMHHVESHQLYSFKNKDMSLSPLGETRIRKETRNRETGNGWKDLIGWRLSGHYPTYILPVLSWVKILKNVLIARGWVGC